LQAYSIVSFQLKVVAQTPEVEVQRVFLLPKFYSTKPKENEQMT